MRPKPRPPEEKPRLSQAGNPYPPGLEPVVIDYRNVPGAVPGSDGPPPIIPNPPDRACMVSFDTYLYEVPGPNLPHLTLWLERQRPDESDERYANYRRRLEWHYCVHAIFLRIIQRLATDCGLHATCRDNACGRRKGCAGRRDTARVGVEFAMYPPCVPLDAEIMETFRAAANRLLDAFYRAESDQAALAGVKEATSEWRSPG